MKRRNFLFKFLGIIYLVLGVNKLKAVNFKHTTAPLIYMPDRSIHRSLGGNYTDYCHKAVELAKRMLMDKVSSG